jgi:hypothetical protein
LTLNRGRLSVGAARLTVRQAISPKPTAAATGPIATARAMLPAGAKNATHHVGLASADGLSPLGIAGAA